MHRHTVCTSSKVYDCRKDFIFNIYKFRGIYRLLFGFGDDCRYMISYIPDFAISQNWVRWLGIGGAVPLRYYPTRNWAANFVGSHVFASVDGDHTIGM